MALVSVTVPHSNGSHQETASRAEEGEQSIRTGPAIRLVATLPYTMQGRSSLSRPLRRSAANSGAAKIQ